MYRAVRSGSARVLFVRRDLPDHPIEGVRGHTELKDIRAMHAHVEVPLLGHRQFQVFVNEGPDALGRDVVPLELRSHLRQINNYI
jgi:hypothetical protein